MAVSSNQLDSGIFNLEQRYRFAVLKLSFFRVLFFAVLGVLILVGLDAFVALGHQMRLALGLLFLAGLLMLGIMARRRRLKSSSLEKRIARLSEAHHPEWGSALMNALDFRTRKEEEAVAETRFLMDCEIQTAATAVGEVDSDWTITPEGYAHEKKRAGWSMVLAVVVGLALFPVFRSVVPRYLFPFADLPPFSLVQLKVEPGDIEVDFNASLEIMAREGRFKPKHVQLVLEHEQGTSIAVPMYLTEKGLHAHLIDQVSFDGTYYIQHATGRTPEYSITVNKTPRIETVRAQYLFPAYTAKKPVLRQLVNQEVKGYAGTKVNVMVMANQPIARGTLTLDGAEVEMVPGESPTVLQAEIELEEAAPFSVQVFGPEGHAAEELYEGRILIVPDQAPDVAILSPPRMSFATPKARIPINIEAGDDVQVQQIALFRNHNDSGDFKKMVYDADRRRPIVNVIDELDFADLGVQPGDQVSFYAAATDNLPDAPQTKSSSAYVISIIGEEAYREYLRAQSTADDLRQRYAELEQAVQDVVEAQAELADEMKALEEKREAGELSDEEYLDRAQELQQQQDRIAQQLNAAIEKIQDEARREGLYDIEKSYKKKLREYAKEMQKALRDMQAASNMMKEGQQQGDPEQCSAQMAQAQAAQELALEQMGFSREDFSESIAAANREIDDFYDGMVTLEHFKQLFQRQQMLEREARFFKDKKLSEADQVRLNELAQEQEQVREELAQVAKECRSNAARLQENYSKAAADAWKMANTIEKLDIPGLMKSASEKMEQGEGKKGYENVEAALDAMSSLVGYCNGMGEGQACERRLQAVFKMNAGQTFAQLMKGMPFGKGQQGQGIGQGLGKGAGSSQSDGYYGSSTPFQLYGDDSQTKAQKAGDGMSRNQSAETGPDHEPERLATHAEERAKSEKTELTFILPEGEHLVPEYEDEILEYFKKVGSSR